MIRTLVPIVVLYGILAAHAVGDGLEVPLEYVKFPERRTSYLPGGIAYPEKSLTPPEGDWKLPELTGEHPVFARLGLGEGEYLMILDRKARDEGFYTRLRIDTNLNRDLTDDPVVEGTFRSQSRGVHLRGLSRTGPYDPPRRETAGLLDQAPALPAPDGRAPGRGPSRGD